MPKLQDLASDEMREARIRRGQVYASSDSKLTKEQEKELWEKAKRAFEEVQAEREEYVYARLVLAALAWTAGIACGLESEEWKDMCSWGGGRLGKVADGAVTGESQMMST